MVHGVKPPNLAHGPVRRYRRPSLVNYCRGRRIVSLVKVRKATETLRWYGRPLWMRCLNRLRCCLWCSTRNGRSRSVVAAITRRGRRDLAKVCWLGMLSTCLFPFLDGIRKVDLQILLVEPRMLSFEVLHSSLSGPLHLCLVSFLMIIE